MNRTVRVRRRKKPPLQALYSGVMPGADLNKIHPNYLFTRVWMGVVPPEDIDDQFCPGYACVVGELFDGDPTQKDRKRIVLDEGICLRAEDFTPRERLRFGIRDDAEDHPTLFTLRDAAVGLKDLYWPDMVYCPPGNSRFFRFLRSTDGLIAYDPRYGDGRYARYQPFFVSRRRTANGVLQVDAEERQHNIELVNSLLSLNLLEVYTDLALFWERRLPTAYRCIGLVCAEMQLNDMTFQVREMALSDGYDYDEEEEARRMDIRRGAYAEAEDLAWWAAGHDRFAGGSQWLQQ